MVSVHTDVMTWRGMFGDGRIAGTAKEKIFVLCGAARGPMMVATVVVSAANGTIRTFGSTGLVSVAPRLLNFDPSTLFPSKKRG